MMRLFATASAEALLSAEAAQLRKYQVAHLLAAHCTGIEATYRLRQALGLSRATAVVASVGSSFSFDTGIKTGELAQ